MRERLYEHWLPWGLFLATLACALSLAGLVALAAVLADATDLMPQVVRLFAVDPIVRRTSLGAAVGLAATAFVFLRPRGSLFPGKPKGRDASKQIAGA